MQNISLNEEVNRQKWLKEVHRGGKDCHKAVEPEKKKNHFTVHNISLPGKVYQDIQSFLQGKSFVACRSLAARLYSIVTMSSTEEQTSISYPQKSILPLLVHNGEPYLLHRKAERKFIS